MHPVVRRLLLILGGALTLGACTAPAVTPAGGAADAPVPVVLVSLDGFRADYLTLGITPQIAALARSGVTTPGMHPSFPSITFPNHYALVTGRRPDRNGIVGNTMTDPAMPGVVFRMDADAVTHDPRWWAEATPVWVSAEQHGLPAAILFWPGSEVAIDGVRPTHWLPFDERMPSDARVDRLLSWFDVPAAHRPRFATLYLNAVDSAGHHDGPGSAGVAASLREVDAAVGRLTAGLAARHIAADIIIVADHGMARVVPGQEIALGDALSARDFTLVTGGAYAGIDVSPDAPPGAAGRIAASLLKPHPHMQCWARGTLPERFHYGANPRVPTFVCLADVGWVIRKNHAAPAHPQAGTHGYDPAAPEMQALFVASGPAFAAGRTIAPFDNVDVYPLVMNLLGLPPEPNDGTITPFLPVLAPGQAVPSKVSP